MDELVIPKGVTRYEHSRSRGWLVRVYRLGKVVARQLFSDGPYGGREAALAAAVLWQTAQELSFPVVARSKKRTPGYGYVQRIERSYRTPGGETRRYDAFAAYFWAEADEFRSTSWSIDQHGEELARELCEDWLAECRRELRSEPLARAG
jgi:hypothetical protein